MPNKVQQRSKDYGVFQNTPFGRSILKDLDQAFGGSCFDENPITMAYKEGRRDVLLYIAERMSDNDISED